MTALLVCEEKKCPGGCSGNGTAGHVVCSVVLGLFDKVTVAFGAPKSFLKTFLAIDIALCPGAHSSGKSKEKSVVWIYQNRKFYHFKRRNLFPRASLEAQ